MQNWRAVLKRKRDMESEIIATMLIWKMRSYDVLITKAIWHENRLTCGFSLPLVGTQQWPCFSLYSTSFWKASSNSSGIIGLYIGLYIGFSIRCGLAVDHTKPIELRRSTRSEVNVEAQIGSPWGTSSCPMPRLRRDNFLLLIRNTKMESCVEEKEKNGEWDSCNHANMKDILIWWADHKGNMTWE